MLTSSYDIAALVLTPLISYIGGSRKKPAFCAWGVFTMGVGFFIFMLPHFISPPYATGSCGEERGGEGRDWVIPYLERFSNFAFALVLHYYAL